MDLSIRLTLIALLGGLILALTSFSASAHKGHNAPESEPAQTENTDDDPIGGDPIGGDAINANALDEGAQHDDDGEAAGGHHGATNEKGTFNQRLISWLGSFHPAVVHIPIGLFIAALLGELLLMTTGQPVYASIVRYCIWIAALGALLAAPLGWLHAGFHLTDTEEFVTTHRWVGTSAAVWSLFLLFILNAAKEGDDRTMLRLALLVGVGLVSFNGFLGGLIVHGADAHAF